MPVVAIILGKCIAFVSRVLRLGAGQTWPGELALRVCPTLLRSFAAQDTTIILITGTNGKTTTAKMIESILSRAGMKTRCNTSGANLENGIVSTFLLDADMRGNLRSTHFIFEVDEAVVPLVLQKIRPRAVLVLNLFRDQLDRYGEVDVVAAKWRQALGTLTKKTTVILNADDPQVAFLGKQTHARIRYFGLNEKKLLVDTLEHATDSTFCPSCGSRLDYSDGVYYSHIGLWACAHCGLKRTKPDLAQWKSSLPGLYNQYNTIAAVLTARELGIHDSTIASALSHYSPAFGRQEEFTLRDKRIKIFLSKNPAGFNMSLRTVLEMKPRVLLLALNDRIPDGRDVSWIWDVDFEMIPKGVAVVVTGDRAGDIAVRMKYARDGERYLFIEKQLSAAVTKSLELLSNKETLYVLPTYSAMLDIRKILIGRKIL